jgi:hypothetical protein
MADDRDRIMIYYVTHDSTWITLRVAVFHYTIFKTDILDLLEILEIEVPRWLEELISRAQKQESRPVPVADYPVTMPPLNALRDMIPTVIEPGMSYPLFGGYQSAGLVINPGGDPEMREIPYRARLCTGKFLGLNFWVQSGILNGACILVSGAELYYKRSTEARSMYPGIDLTGYVEGEGYIRGRIWHRPDQQSIEGCADETFYAINRTEYLGGGRYNVESLLALDCPMPAAFPYWHFWAGQRSKFELKTGQGASGIYRTWFADTYAYPDSLDEIPFACSGDFPSDEFLAANGLVRSEPGAGHVEIIKDPSGACSKPHYMGEGNEVITEEQEAEETPTTGITALLSTGLSLLSQLAHKRLSGNAANARETESTDGEADTIAGRTLTARR